MRRHRLLGRRDQASSLLLLLALPGLFACVTRAPGDDLASDPSRPIDLSPRCLVFDPLAEGLAPLPDVTRHRRISPTLEAVVVPAPGGALHRLRWVAPVAAFRSPTHARAVFFVWSLGEMNADPSGFRMRLRTRGLALSTTRLGDRVVLDLVFPASELSTALETWQELMEPEAIANDRFESIRRELALLLLAEEAAPGAAARRLRHALRGSEPAPGAKAVLDALDGESLRDALLDALAAEAHVLVYSGAAVDARLEAIEATLDRLEDSAASGWGPWTATRSRTQRIAPHRTPAIGGDSLAGASRESGVGETMVGETPAAERAARETPAIHLLDQPGARQVELLATRSTVGRGAADRLALEMLASLLGDPLGGRLFRDLRERQGLAYEIGAEPTGDGHFEVSSRTRPERLGALMVGIEAHWAALAGEPIERCELEMLHERMHGLLALEADEPGSRIDGLVRSWAGPGSPLDLAARSAAYRAVSRETLESVARRRLAGGPEWLLVGDASRVVDRLLEAFPDRRIVVHDASLAITREHGRR